MKNYKDYTKTIIGASDIAALVMVGPKTGGGIDSEILDFGEDGTYKAYIVDEDTEIPGHYSQVAEWAHWFKIYDDDELMLNINADKINIYRAGEMGCIIQVIGRR